MICSITQFAAALANPAAFTTLAGMTIQRTVNGLPILRRTTHWVEGEMIQAGVRYLIAAPLTIEAARSAERLFARLARLRHPSLARVQLLPAELELGRNGVVQRVDVVVQELPGTPLMQQSGVIAREVLCEALDRMLTAWEELGLKHNNLKSENLRWWQGRTIPIRYFDLTVGTDNHRDRTAVEEIKTRLMGGDTTTTEAPTDPSPYDWMGNDFEGLICVRTPAGYGYVDAAHNEVIAPQYHWADDFHEGRAVVQTAHGMGLIDRQGRYILEPIYEIVEYDDVETRIQGRLRGRWIEFDYNGQRKERKK